MLILGKKFLPNRPVAIVVVVAGIVIASMTNLGQHGVKVLGEVPQGLPALGLPAIHWGDINELLPLALACFLLGAVETVAIGRTFSQKHGYRLDSNQEFLALAGANLMSGLGHGFAVSGGMSQSLVNESAGARTPLSGLIAALFTLFVVLFASGLLRNLPQPVLAAIVLAAVLSLVDLHALKAIWRFSRTEFFIAITALGGVLGSGPANGVLLGAGLSIVLLLRQAARPRVTELGRVPGTRYFADRTRNPGNERTPGVLVFRVEASLLYFNTDYAREHLLSLILSRPDPIRLVIFVLGTVPQIDLAGAELLIELQKTLAARDIAFQLADAHGHVRDALRRIGFDQSHGALDSSRSVDDVLARWNTATQKQ